MQWRTVLQPRLGDMSIYHLITRMEIILAMLRVLLVATNNTCPTWAEVVGNLASWRFCERLDRPFAVHQLSQNSLIRYKVDSCGIIDYDGIPTFEAQARGSIE